MRELQTCLMVLVLCLAVPLFAQEEEKSMDQAMKQPPPLEDEFMSWMAGEWEGKTVGPMGEYTENMNCRMGLDGQFFMIEVKSEMGEQTFHGMGAITKGEEGKLHGYWIDNFRTMSEGAGHREGDKVTMVWEDANGTYTRVTEKVDENKFKVHGKMEMKDGSVVESKSEFTRKTMTEKKS